MHGVNIMKILKDLQYNCRMFICKVSYWPMSSGFNPATFIYSSNTIYFHGKASITLWDNPMDLLLCLYCGSDICLCDVRIRTKSLCTWCQSVRMKRLMVLVKNNGGGND
jgi:hypothetical protein